MKPILLAMGSALALLTATPLAADPTTDDVHCLIVMFHLGASDNSTLKAAGVLGGEYFEGKLDGRNPTLDLESLMLAEIPKLNGDALAGETQRCESELTARAVSMKVLGDNLQKKGTEMMQQDNAR
jgi:hypothetical protein